MRWLVGYWVYSISTLVGYLMPNPFSYNFKQFSVALSKTFQFQAIQFSISIDFDYTQLKVKTVLY